MRAWALLGLLILASAASGLAAGTPGPTREHGALEADPHAAAGFHGELDLPAISSGSRFPLDPAFARVERDGWDAVIAPSGIPRYAVEKTREGFRYDVFVRFTAEPEPVAWEAVRAVAQGPVTWYSLAQALHVRSVGYEQVTGLLSVPGVVGVELERSVVPFLDVATANALVVPHPNIGAGARERWNAMGRDAVVAVLDTGIDEEHEVFDLEHYVGGYDATWPTGRVGDELLGSQIPTWTPLNERNPDDDHYRDAQSFAHGTHMAGITFGQDPNATYTGVAPMARFLDVKVISNLTAEAGFPGGPSRLPYGWGSYVLEGLQFVHRYNRGESHLGDPGRDAVDVALMALGETEPDVDGTSVLSSAVDRLVSSGVTVVAAAGNCGPSGHPDCAGSTDTIVAPGAAERAITVGSMTHNRTVGPTLEDEEGNRSVWDESVSAFSSRGPNGGEPKPNLVAYGEPIMAPQGEPDPLKDAQNAYRVGNGTSQAAALVAGIVALMLEVDGDLEPDEVKRILMGTARGPGVSTGPPDWGPMYGAGVVDALFAVGVAFGAWDMDQTLFSQRGQNAQDRVDNPDEEEKKEPREVNQSPVARYHYRPGDLKAGDSVVFIDRSMDPDGDELVSFRWDFGDGATGEGARSAHVYGREGEYRVVLTVTDVNGTAGSWHDVVRVHPSAEVEESGGFGNFWGVVGVALTGAAVLRRRGQKGVGLVTQPEPMGSI